VLDKFKARYPRGRVIYELVEIYDKKYTIRVILIANTELKAEAVGVAPTKELAEEMAFNKAFVILELEASYLNNSQSKANGDTVNRKIINKPKSFLTREELIETFQKIFNEEKTNNEKSQLDNKTDYLDFFEILQEIDRLMLQIGWTQHHGRHYLLRVYGKRSRHSLDDWELLEFLDFLREQVES